MVLPEGVPAPEPRPSNVPRLAGVGLAIAVLLVGALALGRATAPADDAVSGPTISTITIPDQLLSPTTTLGPGDFSIAQIATGRRFFWIKAPPGGRLWPIDLVTHGGQVYLFGSQRQNLSGDAGLGMNAWVSGDGVRWEPLGEVIDENHEVRRVVSTGPGLVALGSRLATREPTVWTSANGMTWSKAVLPTPAHQPGATYRLHDAVVFNGHLRVVGMLVPDQTAEVLPALPVGLMGPDPRSVQLGFEVSTEIDDGVVHVYGPLGLHAFSLPMNDLGLEPDLETILSGPDLPLRQSLWSLSQETGWTSTDLASSAVDELWVSPDGVLVAYGSGSRGSTISTSEDGEEWVAHVRSSQAWIFEIKAETAWRGSLIGSGIGEDLFASDNGVTWERIGTGEMLPDEIGWDLGPVASGQAGLATIAGYSDSSGGIPFEPVSIEIGEAKLSLDLPTGKLRVSKSGYPPLEVLLWVTGADDSYAVDFTTGTVSFTDPGSGDHLVTAGFSTLEEAMGTALAAGATTERALLFTPDGESWSVQDLTNLVSEDSEIAELAILNDRLLMLTRDRVADGTAPPRVTIFVGQIDP